MKILIVGTNKDWAIERVYKEELAKYSEVELFDAHGAFYNYYYKGILNKIKYRLGVSSILYNINVDLLQKVYAYQPDIIWVFKGMEVFPKTLVKIKEMKIPLTNYNPDHPFLFTTAGAGNKNVITGIPFYDHHFCYSLKIKSGLEQKYNVSASWLPFAYNKAVKNETNKIERRICFIGNADESRYQIMKRLLEAKLPITLYGGGWGSYFKSKSNLLEIKDIIFNGKFPKEIQEFVIQLNLFRNQNSGSHNLRTFEMPAMGCIMLAPNSKEHHQLFQENKEAYFYSNIEDLIQKAEKILNMPINDIHRIRENAYRRSIESAYSYENRAKQVYEIFENLLK